MWTRATATRLSWLVPLRRFPSAMAMSTTAATTANTDRTVKRLEFPDATFLVSVAGCPKRTREVVSCLDEVDEPRACGEDAFLAKTQGLNSTRTKQVCLAVFDGVGGWCETPGVDAGRVSHVLMSSLSRELTDLDSGATSPNCDVVNLLQRSFDRMQRMGASDQSLVGSTTACVALVNATPNVPGEGGNDEKTRVRLEVVNVGDSGLLVMRGGKVVFKSKETHAEPTGYVPCQLAVIPPQHKGIGAVESVPSDGSHTNFMLQEGDWVVLASDGVLDNIRVDSLGPALHQTDPTEPVARQLVSAALQGPKFDDITAVVMHVQRLGRPVAVASKL